MRSLAEWRDAWAVWHASESEALALAAAGLLKGRCGLCERETGFDSSPGSPSAWREGLLCRHCRCNARQRAAGTILLELLERPAQARVYATEQSSAFYLALRKRVGRLHGSEFAIGLWQRAHLMLWLLRRGAWPWIRSEDATALRWPDAAMDGIVSLDVLEHVPDYRAALGEFARVLRPGGALALTVPFYEGQAANVQIARLDAQGRVEHFGEPEFHGDPVRGGVPCFHHFGWALLDDIRAAGFADAEICRVQDVAAGLPQGQWVLTARR
ncbi:MAG TPA: class I SAM-dependent methyltransferase [Luteimonas sp.]|nr:class I SAM-dependent methyltransferase [Luteimonas sp.]